MPGTGMTVTVKGPLFTRGQSSRIIQGAVRATIKELVEMGETRLNQVLRPRPSGVYLSVAEARGAGWRTRNPTARDPASKGHYRRSISRHTTVRDRYGLIEGGYNVAVYGPWLEGVGSRNTTTRFKGYAQFRATRDFLNKKKRDVARRQFMRTTRQLNGI